MQSACLLGVAVVLLGAGPNSPEPAEDFRLCDSSTKSPDNGIPACTRLLEPGRSGVNVAAVYLQRGNAWFAKGDYDSAITDYGEAINRNPKFIDAYQNRGRALFKRGDFDRANKDFSEAIRLNPRSIHAFNDRGLSLYNKGEFDLAIKDFTKAISLDSKFAAAYNNRGLAFRDKRKLDNAIADYDEVIKLAPDDPGAHINRAAVWIDKGNIDRAIEDYNQAIRIDPQDFKAYSTRGEALRLKGDLDRALADHDEAIRLEPTSIEAFNNRARAYKDKKQFDRAIADYDEAILLNPQYAQAYAGRGEVWYLKGELERSLADLNKAIGLIPKAPVFLYLRAESLRQKGETDHAIADFTEAIRLMPDAVAAFTGRGLAWEAKGEIGRAKTDYQQALKLPSVPDAETAKPAQHMARSRLEAIASAEEQRLKAAQAEEARRSVQEAERARRELQPGAEPTSGVSLPSPQDFGRRVALVIGNSAYTGVAALPNPRRDAEAMAETLRKIGFQKVSLETNLGHEKLVKVLRSFAREADSADWAVVYYAGHGIEMNGTNYLVPIDAKLENDRDLEFEAVSLDLLMTTVEPAKKLRLVLLDACRDNPFARTMHRSVAQRSIGRGLASIEPDPGTIVVFAAKHGQIAYDGEKHSPFASALMKQITRPGIELRKLFDIVRDDVMEATHRKQQPFTYGSLPGHEDFIFAGK
jgi:tetratricopeptide (TPR) repeat protein